jgi:hypothetical protein
VHAGDDLDEGRLAGTVLPDQRVDLSGVQCQVDPVERDRAGESLGDLDDVDRGWRLDAHLSRRWRARRTR